MQGNKNLDNLTINVANIKIGIVVTYFNQEFNQELLNNTLETLKEYKINDDKVVIKKVAGCLEIPYACQKMIKENEPDVIIALGTIIRGGTSHYDLVTNTTFDSIMKLQLELETPISFGILTCENKEQAWERAGKDGLNKGREATIAALIQTQL